MPARLILLTGPAGIGKNTIAERYVADHPLALSLNVDGVLAMLGRWQADETAARELAVSLAAAMAGTHLRAGHDVIVPYLVLDPAVADTLEAVARAVPAQFVEVVLVTGSGEDEAVARIFRRGTWGEAGTPALAADDEVIVRDLYRRMTEVLAGRPWAVPIRSVEGDVDGTYRLLTTYLAGLADAASKRITDALGIQDSQPGPGDEGDGDSEQAS